MAPTRNVPDKKRAARNLHNTPGQMVIFRADREDQAQRSARPADSTGLADGSRPGAAKPWNGLLAGGVLILILALMVGLRVVALDSDAYPRLSWSSGLLTDEGFYIHNARNQVLFGHPATDDFNNMLIMPALHYLQVAVFTLAGVGAVQARLISVVLSLLTLPIFFAALRRLFGLRVAAIATLFLGLDHSYLLYNRMALMDTPAALLLVCAFAAFVRGTEKQEEEKGREPGVAAQSVGIRKAARASALSLFWCGLWLALAYMTRGLCAFLLPAPLVALWMMRGQMKLSAWRRASLAVLVGLGVALGLYLVLWYAPHRAELAHFNVYYLRNQMMPHSLNHLRQNIVHGLFGDDRGMSPYLVRHTPVQFALALAGLFWWRRRPAGRFSPAQTAGVLFLGLWLLAMWAVLAVISYSPSRYYVLFYPVMAAVAALALVHLREIGAELAENTPLRVLLGGFLAYHVAEAFLHHASRSTDVALYVFTGVVMALLWAWPRVGQWLPKDLFRRGAVLPAAVLGVWAVINLYWMGGWLLHLTYRQKQADRWLAAHLPPDSVLLGDIAPCLCLNNRFKAIHVQVDLCNDHQPVERFAPAPRYILILDGNWKERWWMKHYPDLVAPERRVHLFPRLLRFSVGVYAVPGELGSSPGGPHPGLRPPLSHAAGEGKGEAGSPPSLRGKGTGG